MLQVTGREVAYLTSLEVTVVHSNDPGCVPGTSPADIAQAKAQQSVQFAIRQTPPDGQQMPRPQTPYCLPGAVRGDIAGATELHLFPRQFLFRKSGTVCPSPERGHL